MTPSFRDRAGQVFSWRRSSGVEDQKFVVVRSFQRDRISEQTTHVVLILDGDDIAYDGIQEYYEHCTKSSWDDVPYLIRIDT